MGRESHQIAVWAVVASWLVAMVVAFGALTHGFGIGDGFRRHALDVDPGRSASRPTWASTSMP